MAHYETVVRYKSCDRVRPEEVEAVAEQFRTDGFTELVHINLWHEEVSSYSHVVSSQTWLCLTFSGKFKVKVPD